MRVVCTCVRVCVCVCVHVCTCNFMRLAVCGLRSLMKAGYECGKGHAGCVEIAWILGAEPSTQDTLSQMRIKGNFIRSCVLAHP